MMVEAFPVLSRFEILLQLHDSIRFICFPEEDSASPSDRSEQYRWEQRAQLSAKITSMCARMVCLVSATILSGISRMVSTLSSSMDKSSEKTVCVYFRVKLITLIPESCDDMRGEKLSGIYFQCRRKHVFR